MRYIKWIYCLIGSIVAFPFILAAFLISMLSLGLLYLSKAVFMPAFFIYSELLPKPNDEAAYKQMTNPVVWISQKLLDAADWRY